MNQYHWIEETPVIMISAEDSYTFVERAYDLGASDYITRPFDARVVCRRVSNTLMLYAKQKNVVWEASALQGSLDLSAQKDGPVSPDRGRHLPHQHSLGPA